MPTSRPQCRTPFICRLSSSRGWECGGNRSTRNRAATAAGLAYAREELGSGAFNGEAVHSMDYMEYAYLQMGQDGEAKRVVDELLSFKQANVPNLPMAYAIAALPARYAIERRNWSEAAAVTAPPMPFPWERFPWAEAMIVVYCERSGLPIPATSPAPRPKSRSCSH